jgi:hypothetical protein
MAHTPIKQHKTLTSTLNRLHAKGFVEKVEFGKPIGKTLVQRFQYVAYQSTIDRLILEMVRSSDPSQLGQMTPVSPVNSPQMSGQMTLYSQEESKVSIEKDNSKGVLVNIQPATAVNIARGSGKVVLGSKYQPVADAPAGLSSYQPVEPPAVEHIQFGSTMPLRSEKPVPCTPEIRNDPEAFAKWLNTPQPPTRKLTHEEWQEVIRRQSAAGYWR